jgi:hypothetical protein
MEHLREHPEPKHPGMGVGWGDRWFSRGSPQRGGIRSAGVVEFVDGGGVIRVAVLAHAYAVDE